MRGIGCVVVACLATVGAGDVGLRAAAPLDLVGGPFEWLSTADIDGDGWPDVLTGAAGTITWHAHPGGLESAFESIEVLTGFDGIRWVATADLDQDGDPDVLVGGDAGGLWAENLGLGAAWVVHAFGAAPGPRALAHLDRGGRPDLVEPTDDGLDLRWLRGESGWMIAGEINLGAPAAAICIADLDGDGAPDLASVSSLGLAVHFSDGGAVPAFTTVFVPGLVGSATAIAAADFDGDGDVDLAAAGPTTVCVLWNEDGAGASWIIESIDGAGLAAQRMEAVDFERDGDQDLVVLTTEGLTWYERAGGAWLRRTTSAPGACSIVDLDRDGDLDVVAAPAIGGATWLENAAIHRTATFPSRQPITTDIDGAYAIAAADIDGDGDVDLASVAFNGNMVTWHENTGSSFLSHEIGPSNGPTAVLIVDVDRDGRLDVVSGGSRDNTIRLHRNLGGSPVLFSQQVVSVSASGVFALAAADIDGDGDVDLASACKNDGRVRWHENSAGDGSGWVDRIVLSGAQSPFGIAAGDLDGDGDIDLVSASRDDDRVRWHENDGGSPPSFATRIITSAADGAVAVAIADLDRDGDLDVLSASRNDNSVRWFENDGVLPPAFVGHTITSSAPGATWVGVFDAEADGDLDVLAALRDSHTIAWFQSNGASPPVFSAKIVTSQAQFASGAVAADIDADGRVDVAVASVSDDTIAWHPNRGGQVAASSAVTAPGSIPVLRTDDVLRYDLINRGRAGELSVRPSRAVIRLEDEAGTALTSAQASALFTRLIVALDGSAAGGGSGSFEPLKDLVLSQASPSALLGGEVTVEIPDGTGLEIAPGASRRLFVGVTMTADAGLQALRRFRVTLRATSAAMGRDTTFGIETLTEAAADVSTGIVEARCSADLTGSSDPRSPDYGEPDGLVDASDFFYFLDRFAGGDAKADMTGSGDPNDPAYGNSDGDVDASDFFYYLDRFVAGC